MIDVADFKRWLPAVGAGVVFRWIREELARAVSREVPTLLLVAYYAVGGVAGMMEGRRRNTTLLRQSGLALAVYAALEAIWVSSSLSIGWRVAADLLDGLFLLGAAYLYRAAGSRAADDSATAETQA